MNSSSFGSSIQNCKDLSILVDQLNGQNYVGFSKRDLSIQGLFITEDSSAKKLTLDELSTQISIVAATAASLFSFTLTDRGELEEALRLHCHTITTFSSYLDPGPIKEELLKNLLNAEQKLLGPSSEDAHRIFRPRQACCSRDEAQKIILFHHQILHTKKEGKELGTVPPSKALECIIEDLTQYSIHTSTHPGLPTLIDDLKFALSIKKQYYESFNSKDIAKRVCERVHLMSQKDNPASVIIAGGCSDHTVYYQIYREKMGYAFTIFNTGLGAYRISETDPRIKILQYEKIPLEKLINEDFLEKLIDSKKDDSMERIDKIIYDHFFCERLKNCTFVHKQNSQVGNSCVTKALMCLIRHNLGKEEERSFKAWLTEIKINWLRSIENKLVPEFYQMELGFAQEALDKRKIKALQVQPAQKAYFSFLRFW